MDKIHAIEISFPIGVELPDGWEQALDGLVNMVCKQYEKENPTRVMWPAGYGSKPIYDEPNEPTFDGSVYTIEVSEREDFGGRNPLNPDGEKLRKKAHEEGVARRKQRDERKHHGLQ